jgi:5-methylcytosine-specific restriction endonuclease McrA
MPIKLQGHRYRTQRAEFKEQSKQRNDPCWLCGKRIDYDAPPQTALAFEIDHAIPRATRADLAWDTTNWRPSHSSCNRARGNTPATTHQPRWRGWTAATW